MSDPSPQEPSLAGRLTDHRDEPVAATLGLLFESLALTRGFGDWTAVEIKLGGADAIASAVESLRRVRSRFDTQQAGEPSRLIVLTAVGQTFETVDDIAVVPITLLGP